MLAKKIIDFMERVSKNTLPSIRDIQQLVDRFSEHDNKYEKALAASLDPYLQLEGGQYVNSLSGDCVEWTRRLAKFLRDNNIEVRVVSSRLSNVHTFLAVMTHEGRRYIDPTIAQCVAYPHCFFGSIAELREIFLDPGRSFFLGRQLWAVDHDILTREEWFQIYYTIDD